jgi:hypothetical protein
MFFVRSSYKIAQRKDSMASRLIVRGFCLPGLYFVLMFSTAATQTAAGSGTQAPVSFTSEQDHQNMMDQLGIKQVRPGPSGNRSAPNHANYDPSTANLFPNYPDALTLNNGKQVTTPAMWWNQRSPEIGRGSRWSSKHRPVPGAPGWRRVSWAATWVALRSPSAWPAFCVTSFIQVVL